MVAAGIKLSVSSFYALTIPLTLTLFVTFSLVPTIVVHAFRLSFMPVWMKMMIVMVYSLRNFLLLINSGIRFLNLINLLRCASPRLLPFNASLIWWLLSWNYFYFWLISSVFIFGHSLSFCRSYTGRLCLTLTYHVDLQIRFYIYPWTSCADLLMLILQKGNFFAKLLNLHFVLIVKLFNIRLSILATRTRITLTFGFT